MITWTATAIPTRFPHVVLVLHRIILAQTTKTCQTYLAHPVILPMTIRRRRHILRAIPRALGGLARLLVGVGNSHLPLLGVVGAMAAMTAIWAGGLATTTKRFRATVVVVGRLAGQNAA